MMGMRKAQLLPGCSVVLSGLLLLSGVPPNPQVEATVTTGPTTDPVGQFISEHSSWPLNLEENIVSYAGKAASQESLVDTETAQAVLAWDLYQAAGCGKGINMYAVDPFEEDRHKRVDQFGHIDSPNDYVAANSIHVISHTTRRLLVASWKQCNPECGFRSSTCPEADVTPYPALGLDVYDVTDAYGDGQSITEVASRMHEQIDAVNKVQRGWGAVDLEIEQASFFKQPTGTGNSDDGLRVAVLAQWSYLYGPLFGGLQFFDFDVRSMSMTYLTSWGPERSDAFRASKTTDWVELGTPTMNAEFGRLLQQLSGKAPSYGQHMAHFSFADVSNAYTVYTATSLMGVLRLELINLMGSSEADKVVMAGSSEVPAVGSWGNVLKVGVSPDGNTAVGVFGDQAFWALRVGLDGGQDTVEWEDYSEDTFVTFPLVSQFGVEGFDGIATYVGLGCVPDNIPDPIVADGTGHSIAVIAYSIGEEDGNCSLRDRIRHVAAKGYQCVLIADFEGSVQNNLSALGHGQNVPAVYVPGNVGMVIMGKEAFADLEVGDVSEKNVSVRAEATPLGWGGVNIFDYGGVLDIQDVAKHTASWFTKCGFAAQTRTNNAVSNEVPECEQGGLDDLQWRNNKLTTNLGLSFTPKDVYVERVGDGSLSAYVAYGSDGLVVLDVSDASEPREVARWMSDSPVFENINGDNPQSTATIAPVTSHMAVVIDEFSSLYIIEQQDAPDGLHKRPAATPTPIAPPTPPPTTAGGGEGSPTSTPARTPTSTPTRAPTPTPAPSSEASRGVEDQNTGGGGGGGGGGDGGATAAAVLVPLFVIGVLAVVVIRKRKANARANLREFDMFGGGGDMFGDGREDSTTISPMGPGTTRRRW